MTESTNETDTALRRRPVILGEVLFDRFPDATSVLGGAPFNVAWHLRGFGADPLFISRVGDDAPGSAIRQAMRDWGMDESGLRVDAGQPTGAVDISIGDSGHSFDILADQAYDGIDEAQCLAATQGVETAFIYHGTLILRSEMVREALDALLAATGMPVFLDVNLREPWWRQEDLPGLLERATWVKVNDEELAVIAELLGQTGDSLEDTASRLRVAFDLSHLVVTEGERGARILDANGHIASITPDTGTEIVDTVGAGDAFCSIVLLGLLRDWPLDTICARAQSFAGRVCGQRGATRSDESMYRALLSQWGNDTA